MTAALAFGRQGKVNWVKEREKCEGTDSWQSWLRSRKISDGAEAGSLPGHVAVKMDPLPTRGSGCPPQEPPRGSAVVGPIFHSSHHAMWAATCQTAMHPWLGVCPKDLAREEHTGERKQEGARSWARTWEEVEKTELFEVPDL